MLLFLVLASPRYSAFGRILSEQSEDNIFHYQRRSLSQCSSCEASDGGQLCNALPRVDLAALQADLLFWCPLSVFPLGMDACCQALVKYDWATVESCVCSGRTGLAGFIVSPNNIIESCGCTASRSNDSIALPIDEEGVALATDPTGVAVANAEEGVALAADPTGAAVASATVFSGDVSPP